MMAVAWRCSLNLSETVSDFCNYKIDQMSEVSTETRTQRALNMTCLLVASSSRTLADIEINYKIICSPTYASYQIRTAHCSRASEAEQRETRVATK